MAVLDPRESALGINPRYANYCRAHGKTPDEMLAFDRERWPGGLMTGYLLWHNERLQEASKRIPNAFMGDAIIDHPAYDAWLTARVDELLSPDGLGELRDIEARLSAWLTDHTANVFDEEEPEIDEARNLILERIEKGGAS